MKTRKLTIDEAAKKLSVKVVQIWNDEEISPKETSERLQSVIAEALREARA